MIVYVVFLLISSVISNDDNMSKIALGATLSGIFFAFSDSLLNPVQYFCNEYDSIKKAITHIKEQILNLPEDIKSKNNKYDACLNDLSKCEKTMDKNLKHIKRMRVAGYIFFAIGIFVFLFVVTFYSNDYKIFQYLLKYENNITITAFAMVIFNYFIQDVFFINHQKEYEEIEKIVEDKLNKQTQSAQC